MGEPKLSPRAIAAIAGFAAKALHRYSRNKQGGLDLGGLLSDWEIEEAPRSLNGCDTLLMPQILKDFPDFDVNLSKTYVKQYLTEALGSNSAFTIHNVVIARYFPSGAQKTILFQAAVSWLEQGKRLQKRYDLHYTYMLSGSDEVIAANCPNCGGALAYGVTTCPYCDSRVVNILGNSWVFTEMNES